MSYTNLKGEVISFYSSDKYELEGGMNDNAKLHLIDGLVDKINEKYDLFSEVIFDENHDIDTFEYFSEEFPNEEDYVPHIGITIYYPRKVFQSKSKKVSNMFFISEDNYPSSYAEAIDYGSIFDENSAELYKELLKIYIELLKPPFADNAIENRWCEELGKRNNLTEQEYTDIVRAEDRSYQEIVRKMANELKDLKATDNPVMPMSSDEYMEVFKKHPLPKNTMLVDMRILRTELAQIVECEIAQEINAFAFRKINVAPNPHWEDCYPMLEETHVFKNIKTAFGLFIFEPDKKNVKIYSLTNKSLMNAYNESSYDDKLRKYCYELAQCFDDTCGGTEEKGCYIDSKDECVSASNCQDLKLDKDIREYAESLKCWCTD